MALLAGGDHWMALLAGGDHWIPWHSMLEDLALAFSMIFHLLILTDLR